MLASKNYYSFIAACVSVVIHVSLLLIGGRFLIHKAEYNIQQGAISTEIDLVSSVEPVEKSVEPKESEPAEASINEPIKKESVPAEVPMSKPAKKVRIHSKVKKSLHSSKPSRRAVSSGQGAKVSAKPDYLHNPPPRYPVFAREAHQQGLVIMRVVVSQYGKTLSLVITSSSGFKSLDNAAVEAVRNWQFKPGTIGGVPVKSVIQVPVRFQLEQQ